MTTLNQRLLQAHATGDTIALVALYLEAADGANDPDAEAFYLTHAHVYALEIGDARADSLRARLIEAGRESPLQPPIPPLR